MQDLLSKNRAFAFWHRCARKESFEEIAKELGISPSEAEKAYNEACEYYKEREVEKYGANVRLSLTLAQAHVIYEAIKLFKETAVDSEKTKKIFEDKEIKDYIGITEELYNELKSMTENYAVWKFSKPI